MNLPPPTGSPIEARIENQSLLPVILGIAVGVVFVIFIVMQIARQIRNAYDTQSFSERQRARFTNMSDIRAVTKEYAFTYEESQYLFEICKTHKVPNVRFFLKDHEQTTRLFKAAFRLTNTSTIPDRAQTLIFSMYEKINKSRLANSLMSTTTHLPVGQKLLYIDPDGKKFVSSIIENNENEMIIATPKDKGGNEIILPDLSKITLMIQGKNEIAFTTSVRIIRYQVKQGDPVVVTTHSTQFEPFFKQEYMYVQARLPCLLQPVNTQPTASGGEKKVAYKVEGKIHNGVLLNYSGTSCNIVVKNSINVHQLLQLKAKIDGQLDVIVVMVMNIVPNEDRRAFLIHANFVHVPARTKNTLLSHVFSFVT